MRADQKPTRRVFCLACVALLALASTPTGFAQSGTSFGTALEYTAAPNAGYVAVGDFNNDGMPDLVIAGGTVPGITIMLAGMTDDGRMLWTRVPVSAAATAAIAVADLNGDGAQDLVLAQPGENGCRILLNNGDGLTFTDGGFIETGTAPNSVAVADLNGDGIADIVSAGSDVSIALGAGKGIFGAPTSYPFGFPLQGLVVADFNGDGHPDVAAGGQGVAGGRFALGDGTGALVTASLRDFDSAGTITSLVSADVDRDGRPDLIATAVRASPSGSMVGILSVLLNDGAGGFKAPAQFDAGVLPTSVAVADLDGDGYPDYAVACSGCGVAGSRVARVMLGDGAGGITASTDLPLPGTPAGIAAVDLTLDNEPDLIVSEASRGNVAVLVNTAVFDLPIADAGPDFATVEGADVTLDGWRSRDPFNVALAYTWTTPAGDVFTGRQLTFRAPSVGRAGATLTFRLVVSDGTSDSKPDFVNVFVANVDQPPIANAGPDQTVDERTTVTLDGTASFDPDGERLAYSWVQTAGTPVSLSDPASPAPTFGAPEVGRAGGALEFELTVTSFGLASSDRVAIFVNNVNRPPAANAGADLTVNEGDTFQLSGAASSDPDGDPLTYHWTQIAPSQGFTVILSDDHAVAPSGVAPSVPVGGVTLTFMLEVSDGIATASDTVDVLVANVNHPPVAEIADVDTGNRVNEGSTVTLDGSASYDPDGAVNLTYSWAQTAGPSVTLLQSTPASPTATFTAPSVAAGSSVVLTFQLTVSDGIADSQPVSINVTVEHVNHPPTADAGQDQTVAPGMLVTLRGSGSDPDGDALVYHWRQTGDGPRVTLVPDPAGLPNVSFTAPDFAGTLEFTLDVSDGTATASAAVHVTVHHGPPLCDLARPSVPVLWPPNHKLIPVSIVGVSDPTAAPVTFTINAVTQDEPVSGLGDGDTAPDAVVGDTLLLRAERSGRGNGRVYRVSFTADDHDGGVCSGAITVAVPLSLKGTAAIGDAQQYDSTAGAAPAKLKGQ
jgi:hypothetical protein